MAGGLDKIVSIPTFFCYPRSDGLDNNPSGSASLKLTACKVLPHFFLFSILGEIRIFFLPRLASFTLLQRGGIDSAAVAVNLEVVVVTWSRRRGKCSFYPETGDERKFEMPERVIVSTRIRLEPW